MRCTPAPNGYTLVELLVVIAIIGLMIAIGTPAATKAIDASQFRADEHVVTAELRDYRSIAVQQQKQITLSGPVDGQTLTKFKMRGLSDDTELRIDEPISWFPDGTTTGGRVVLRRGDRSKAVVVTWLTGTMLAE